MIGRDDDRMFGSPLNILRGCSLALLFPMLVALIICYPILAIILLAVVFFGGVGIAIAFMIGDWFGWWDSI